MRTNLLGIRNFAEEIAIEGGEQFHADRLEKQIDDLSIKTAQRVSIQNKTAAFNVLMAIFKCWSLFLQQHFCILTI
ncbi:hypothetical protein J2N86_05630 [Legionella lytica]|uniref:Uncharacterized protein n=1 Tax=Legionella lytica TaxID=96232 RepID=A0ABY4YDQ0_9GAMM|nr:hypothetical protein [Legionella lytica]USQ15224.1 hypothetical protein J2N86_05630 [Legionella lytica]